MKNIFILGSSNGVKTQVEQLKSQRQNQSQNRAEKQTLSDLFVRQYNESRMQINYSFTKKYITLHSMDKYFTSKLAVDGE